MIYQETTSLYDRLVEEFEAQLANDIIQSENLIQLKTEAFKRFKEKGFPTVKEEDWRFTSLVPFLKEDYNLQDASINNKQELQQLIAKAAIPALDTYLLVTVNGRVHLGLSNLPDEGMVNVDSIHDISDTPDFKRHLKNSNNLNNPLIALNTAFFNDGLYLEVKKNVILDKPVHLLHLYTAEINTFFQPRQMIVINEGAKAVVLETSVVNKTDAVVLVNNFTETEVGPNAQLVHYEIQNPDHGERWLHHYEVTQQRDSRYDHFSFSLPGADLLRNNLNTTLNGTGSETHLYGLYLVAGQQLTDNHTSIRHKYPACRSNEIYKGVLMGKARGVFNGKVFVEQEAQKTNAFQQNNNLLLSSDAQIHAKPQLEIFADDVKCSHGCTVGQFNPESLFYLRSRGIGENEAKKILVEAFLFEVTEKISDGAIKAYVQVLVYNKMENALHLLIET